MSEESPQGQDEARTEEAFVGRLVPDPNVIPDTRLLTGYLGRSTQPGLWRLYLRADFRSYIEIADGDIIGTEKLLATPYSPARTAVWVKGRVRLELVQDASVRTQAKFLGGEL